MFPYHLGSGHLRATGRGDEVIPLLAGQFEIRSRGQLFDLLRPGRADDGDDLGRVLEDPSQGDELTADPTLDDVFLDATGRTRTRAAGEVMEVSQ